MKSECVHLTTPLLLKVVIMTFLQIFIECAPLPYVIQPEAFVATMNEIPILRKNHANVKGNALHHYTILCLWKLMDSKR